MAMDGVIARFGVGERLVGQMMGFEIVPSPDVDGRCPLSSTI